MVVSGIAELRALDSGQVSHAFVAGYYQAGDGGGGHYYRDPADTTSGDNGGTLIVGADGGRWKLIHQGPVSIRQFGAKLDGVTDDRSFVQTAVDAVSHVSVPPGTCRITATLRLRSHLLLELAPDAVIDFSGAAPGDTLFSADGVLGHYVPLTADAAVGVRRLEVRSSADFAVGDWVKIKAETAFDQHSTGSKIGEINRVIEGYGEVGGDDLTATSIPLVAEVQSTYRTEAGAAVAKLILVQNIAIRGGTLVGMPNNENDQTAVRFNYALNCRVEDVVIEQFDQKGVLAKNSIGITIEGCRFANSRPTTQGYGVSFSDAAADGIASNNHFDEVRHSLSTNNSPASDHGIVRRILFSNNTVRSSARAASGAGGDAIDTHTAAEDISIIGNTVLAASGAGINVECPSAVIVGNTINDSFAHAIHAHNEADHNGDIVIASNRVQRSGGTGILVQHGFRGTRFGYTKVVVEGNTVERAGLRSGLSSAGIAVKAASGDGVNRAASITGNSVRDPQGFGIHVHGIRFGAITGNSLSNVANVGIEALNIQSVSIGSNSVQMTAGSTRSGIRLSVDGAGATRHNAIVGNTIGLTAGSSGARSVELEDEVTETAVVANIQQGGSGGVVLGSGTGNVQALNV